MINFTYRTKVYYKDVDKMGVVDYTRYFEYFEAARTELLQSISLDVTTIENEGYYLPVISSHCDYKSGANFEDELLLKLAINKPPKSTMKIDYEVYRSSNEELLVTGYTIHAFTDQSGKAVKPPKRLLEAIHKNS